MNQDISCYKHMLGRFKKIQKSKYLILLYLILQEKKFLYFHKKAKNISEFNQRSSIKKEKDGLDINKKIEVNCIFIKNILDST